MWPLLVHLAFAQATVTVGPGESVRDAILPAGRGGTILVEPGADTSQPCVFSTGVDLTVRSAVAEPVEICAVQLRNGARVHLERVIVPTRSFSQSTLPATFRGIHMLDGTLTGTSVELRQTGPAQPGLLQFGGSVEIDDFRVRGFRQQRPIVIENHTAQRTLILRDCELTDNTAGVALLRGTPANGDQLTLEDCLVHANAAPGSSLLTIEGGGAVRVFGGKFANNQSQHGTLDVVGALDLLDVHTSIFCPSASSPHLRVGPAASAKIHRTVFYSPAGVASPLSVDSQQGYPWIVQNTFLGGAGAAERAVAFGASGSGVLANNIFYELAAIAPQPPAGGQVFRNLVFGDAPAWLSADDADSILADPEFVDRFDPTSCEVLPLLTSGSPAVDAGVEIPEITDPVDDPGSPDLGALPLRDVDPGDPADPNDPVEPDPPDERWLTGGACASLATPSGWLPILLGLALAGLRGRSRRLAGARPPS